MGAAIKGTSVLTRAELQQTHATRRSADLGQAQPGELIDEFVRADTCAQQEEARMQSDVCLVYVAPDTQSGQIRCRCGRAFFLGTFRYQVIGLAANLLVLLLAWLMLLK